MMMLMVTTLLLMSSTVAWGHPAAPATIHPAERVLRPLFDKLVNTSILLPTVYVENVRHLANGVGRCGEFFCKVCEVLGNDTDTNWIVQHLSVYIHRKKIDCRSILQALKPTGSYYQFAQLADDIKHCIHYNTMHGSPRTTVHSTRNAAPATE